MISAPALAEPGGRSSAALLRAPKRRRGDQLTTGREAGSGRCDHNQVRPHQNAGSHMEQAAVDLMTRRSPVQIPPPLQRSENVWFVQQTSQIRAVWRKRRSWSRSNRKRTLEARRSIAANVHPAPEPLPQSSHLYRDQRGERRRLTIAAVPKPFDPEAFARVLIHPPTNKSARKRESRR